MPFRVFQTGHLFHEASNEPFGLSAILMFIQMIREEEAELHRTHMSHENELGPELNTKSSIDGTQWAIQYHSTPNANQLSTSQTNIQSLESINPGQIATLTHCISISEIIETSVQSGGCVSRTGYLLQ